MPLAPQLGWIAVIGVAARLSAAEPNGAGIGQLVGQASRLSAGRLALEATVTDETPGAAGGTPAPPPEQLQFFERKVRPLLAENCYSCHGEEKQKNHLRLDSPAAIRVGGESGAVIVPEHPEKSRLVIAVGYQDEDLKMPPKKRLSARQVADLTEWVKMGAPMPP